MIEWKQINGAEHYEVSSSGEVRSKGRTVKSGRGGSRTVQEMILSPILKNNGYLAVKINGKQRTVHSIVLEAFHGPNPGGMVCCHNDGNKLNNCALNLRWDTQKNNVLDRNRHGTTPIGEASSGSKLTRDQVLKIRKDARPRNVVCKDYGVTPEAISSIVLRKSWAWLS